MPNKIVPRTYKVLIQPATFKVHHIAALEAYGKADYPAIEVIESDDFRSEIIVAKGYDDLLHQADVMGTVFGKAAKATVTIADGQPKPKGFDEAVKALYYFVPKDCRPVIPSREDPNYARKSLALK